MFRNPIFYLGFLSGFLFSVSVFPHTAIAAGCVEKGYTVIFINGVNNTYKEAELSRWQLQDSLGKKFNNEPLTVEVAYNPTHLDGFGDILETTAQLFGSSISNVDLVTVLRDMHEKVGTRKLLVVGHSQGALYANSVYDYLWHHGEPIEAIGVYAVGTPASFVAGGGGYLTSTLDSVILLARMGLPKDKQPLPGNFVYTLESEDTAPVDGHGFVDFYLTAAPSRIVADIHSALLELRPTYPSNTGECFTAPDSSFGYISQKITFAIADPLSVGVRVVVVAVGDTVHAGYRGAAYALGGLTELFSLKKALPTPTKETDANTFTVVKKLYGASVTPEDLAREGLGAAVVLAVPEPQQTEQSGEVLGVETNESAVVVASTTPTTPSEVVLPDIPSTTPLFATAPSFTYVGPTPTSGTTPKEEEVATTTEVVLFTSTTTPPTLTALSCSDSMSTDACVLPYTSISLSWTTVAGATTYKILLNDAPLVETTGTSATVSVLDGATSTLAVVSYDASTTPITSNTLSVLSFTRPLIINEIAWAGSLDYPNDEWIEIKNRTPFTLSLASTTLYAVSGGTQTIPLSGSVAPVGNEQSFFLVERNTPFITMTPTRQVLATSFDTLLDTGEELALSYTGASGTLVLDSTPPVSVCGGWCAGSLARRVGESAMGYASEHTLSMERVSGTISGAEATAWASNDMYIVRGVGTGASVIYGSAGQENSLHWGDAGFFCSPDEAPITPNSRYHVASEFCRYLSRFVDVNSWRSFAIFKGTVGSSTLLQIHRGSSMNSVNFFYTHDDYLTGLTDGDALFAAMWEKSTEPPTGLAQDMTFESYFVAGTTTPPHSVYRTIPFIYVP